MSQKPITSKRNIQNRAVNEKSNDTTKTKMYRGPKLESPLYDINNESVAHDAMQILIQEGRTTKKYCSSPLYKNTKKNFQTKL